MLRNRHLGLTLLLILLGSVSVQADDASSLSTLKEKGLIKAGHFFVIEAEKPVLAKIKEVRTAAASYAQIAERQAIVEQIASHLSQLEEHRAELQDNLNDLNQRINEQGFQQTNNGPRPGPNGPPQGGVVVQMIAHRDQIKATLTNVTSEQKSLKAEALQAKDRTTLDEDVKKKRETLKTALAELRPMVDEVTRKYTELGADATVKTAIGELQKATKASLKLGPSDGFQAGAKALDQAERQFLGKKMTVIPKKKGKTKK